MIEIVSSESAPERVPLFSIDGVEYGMPARISGATSLQVLEVIAERGEVASLPTVLRMVLGDEAYMALRSCPSVTMTDLNRIMTVVRNQVLGSLEGGPGES